MGKISTKRIVLVGIFTALGILLPFVTGQIPSIGNKLLPMHIPVLIAGYVCGWQYGLIIGFVVPILRSLLFGMPPMFPIAIAMAVELAVYGLITGLLYKLFPKKKIYIYISLILAMIFGRAAWGVVSYFLYSLNGTAFTWQMFMAGAFINASIGIAIQIVLIPTIISALNRSRALEYE